MKIKTNDSFKFFLLCILLIIIIIIFKYKKIKIAIYYNSLKNGGAQRMTALLIKYISKEKLFDIYLFLNEKVENEYQIPFKVKRRYFQRGIDNLRKQLIKNNINIIIYQFYDVEEIRFLNNLKHIKTIIIIHCCFLSWIYLGEFKFIKSIYNEYKNSKYIVSLVPFENDFLFKKWGINSILLNNFITYDFDNISPSDLSSKTILMIGRASDKRKRFSLGIKAMEYIIKEIPECEMKIISEKSEIQELIELVGKLRLERNIKFLGYTTNPAIHFKNASLNIIPSSTESFSLVLCETKAYGIPNIITGINYISPAKGGVINVIDDDPKSIAKEAIKILNNEQYRKQLGKEARESMAEFKNSLTSKKWSELILSVYKGDIYYQQLKEKDKKISEKESLEILKTQIQLLKKRNETFQNMTIEKLIQILN